MEISILIDRRFRRGIQLLAGLVTIMALEALLGWVFHWPCLFAPEKGRWPMAFGTVLGFLLLGPALWAHVSLARPRDRLVRLAAWLVIGLGLLRVLGFLSGETGPFSEQFWESARGMINGLIPPSRMKFFTAVCFVLAGLTLLILTYQKGRRFFNLAGYGLAAGVTIIGFVCWLGYLYAAPLAPARRPTPMASSTSVAFFLYGTGLLLLAIRREVSERMAARLALVTSERELREQKGILQSILNSMGEAVIVADQAKHLILFNPAAKRIFGDDLLKLPLSEWPEHCGLHQPTPSPPLPPEQLPLTQAIRGNTVEHMELMLRRSPTDAGAWLTVSARPLLDEAGRIAGGVMVCRDITARRRAEQERDRFFNLSRDLFCIAGFDGYFKSLNAAWTKTLGFREEDLMSKPYVSFVHPDDRAATLAEAKKLSEGQETIYFENRYLCQDGTYKWLLWSARVLQEEQLVYAAARDITEHKETQERIQKLNADVSRRATELEALNKELEAFTYSVSHDLRAPVRHIDAFTTLLRKALGEHASAEAKDFLGIIAASTAEMNRLIDDLLLFSRMGRQEMLQKKIDLNAVLEEAFGKLGQEMDGRQIVWNKGPLPQVQADPALLRQVFINLLSNAIKYTRGRAPAEIDVGCQANGPAEVVVFVRDNGVGFDMQYADKLFGVFQRLHRAEEFEGTGIGLANVRRIIARHGGRTWAEAKVGRGATFYFSVPIHPSKN